MGLLDEAIREHLELKRRRGADPSEVEQQESEALGPVPRGEGGRALPPTESPDEDARDAYEDEGLPALVPADDAPAERVEIEDRVEYEIDLPDDEDDDPFVPLDEPQDAAIPSADLQEERTRIVPPPPAAREEPPAPTPAEPAERVDQPTSAYSLEDLEQLDDRPRASPPADVVPADDEPGEHDVLEETPDFLEETPEHDRLWFEQKPPRDFDF